MWIRFKNNVTVNIDTVIKFEKTRYASGIIFYCNGFGFTLRFDNQTERDNAYESINRAIIYRDDFVEININTITD